jgi:hypothetical protein
MDHGMNFLHVVRIMASVKLGAIASKHTHKQLAHVKQGPRKFKDSCLIQHMLPSRNLYSHTYKFVKLRKAKSENDQHEITG